MTSSGIRASLRRSPASADGDGDGYTGGPVWMWFLPPAGHGRDGALEHHRSFLLA